MSSTKINILLGKMGDKGGQIDRYKIVNLIPKSVVSHASHLGIQPEHIKVTDKCAQCQGVVDLYE